MGYHESECCELTTTSWYQDCDECFVACLFSVAVTEMPACQTAVRAASSTSSSKKC